MNKLADIKSINVYEKVKIKKSHRIPIGYDVWKRNKYIFNEIHILHKSIHQNEYEYVGILKQRVLIFDIFIQITGRFVQTVP